MLRRLIPHAATHGARWFGGFFPDLLWRIETEEPVVYLTFDDGPTPSITERLLDTLSSYDASATFFLIGSHAEEHPDLVRSMHRAGHRIGNHTYTHPHPWQTPDARLTAELDRTTRRLRELTGTPLRCMRPPYGEITGAQRTWCANHQQRMVMWDVMPGDYLETATADGVARFVLKRVRPGSIVVLHDNPVCEHVTPAALDTILQVLSAEGWRFDAL